MPQQTIFLDQTVGNTRIEVLKSYDKAFAREAFDQMDAEALEFLAQTLDLDSSDKETADTIWDELKDGAREDWNSFSYFIVAEESRGRIVPLFVSADWPSAEAFAKKRISLLQ
jgi:hypothetical protein